MEIPIYNLEGQKTESFKVPEEIFGLPRNDKLLAQAVRFYEFNQRQGTASTKTRGEVKGSTKKIYRQKGTGRARHGSKRAPIFVKGGIVFGPKPRDFSLKLPQKMKKKALYLALSQKYQEQKIKILEGLKDLEAKTKMAISVLKKLNLNPDKEKILFLHQKVSPKTLLAFRNIAYLTVFPVSQLNAYEVLKNETLLFSKEALESLISSKIKLVPQLSSPVNKSPNLASSSSAKPKKTAAKKRIKSAQSKKNEKEKKI